MAAVLACGEAAMLSHTSAAELWGMCRRHPGPIHITVVGTGGRKQRRGILLHRSSTLTAQQRTVRHGIPVTSAARTLEDLRPLLSPAQFALALREAEFRRLAVGNQEKGDGSRSELEARMLALCRRHRLPQPEVNASIDGYLVDFIWADASLIVEMDGWESHRTRSAFEADRARDARLAVLGYEVIRFTWRQVTDDARGVAKTVRALLRVRS